MGTTYDEDFYATVGKTAASSAAVIAPIIAQAISPGSVIDVGCGSGSWLRAFMAAGCTGVGVDGSTVTDDVLVIPRHAFHRADLSDPVDLASIPRRCGRFDLAVCLEVGEHLPAAASEAFVDCLSRLSDAVLFSAATPGQGGLHHVNEQPPAYWAEKFAQRGYVACDLVRPVVWDDERVAWWYAQNTLLYLKSSHFAIISGSVTPEAPRWLIHPTAYLQARSRPMGVATVVRAFPTALLLTFQHRWRRATRR